MRVGACKQAAAHKGREGGRERGREGEMPQACAHRKKKGCQSSRRSVHDTTLRKRRRRTSTTTPTTGRILITDPIAFFALARVDATEADTTPAPAAPARPSCARPRLPPTCMTSGRTCATPEKTLVPPDSAPLKRSRAAGETKRPKRGEPVSTTTRRGCRGVPTKTCAKN